MSWKIVLLSCLMAALIPDPGNTWRLFSWLPGYQGFFGGQNVLINATSGIISGAKQAVNTIAGVKSQALSSVVNATKQVMDMGARMTAPIPLVGTAVGLGTNMIKAGADAVNTVGQAKISFIQNLKNAKLSMIERMFGISKSTTVRPITSTASTLATTTFRPLTSSTSTTTTTRSTTSAIPTAASPTTTRTTTTAIPTAATPTTTRTTTTAIPSRTTAGTSASTLATVATSASISAVTP